MKKILFTLVTLVASMSISAQVVRLYKNGNLVAAFNKSQADEIVFEEVEENGAIDLGLSVKWASCNLGANKPEEAGKHYAWGEAVPQANNVYSWSSYRWCNGSSKSLIKYCTDSSYGTVDNKKMLLPVDDAAQVNLAEGWRMPSKAEMQELIDKCAWKWTTKNGTPGYEVTASNGNSIFLPVTGTRYDSSLNSADWLGSYWTSSLYEKWNDYANYLTFSENNHSVATMFRCMGMAIRPVYDKHEYVDLGLPSGLKWATCNVGASKPEDYGFFFAWGETTPQSNNRYYWDSYIWCNYNGTKATITKYCTESGYGTVDNKTTLELVDDAAYVNWGGSWRMPTTEEIDELCKKCNWVWTSKNGVYGYIVTGPNTNSIFLPAAGYYRVNSIENVGSGGFYWSSTLTQGKSENADFLYCSPDLVNWLNLYRYYGRSVRPVHP